MPDIFLRPVPIDANPADVRLRNPTIPDSGGTVYNVSASDAAAASDALGAALIAAGAIVESASSLDAPSASAISAAAMSESATGADTVSSAVIYPSAISEAATGADAVSAGTTIPASIAEAAAGSDMPSSAAVYPSVISESSSAAETVSIGGASYSVSVAEAPAAVDAVASAAVLPSAISEAASSADLAAVAVTTAPAITEAAGAAETVASQTVAVAALAEAFAAVDAASVAVIIPAAIVETVLAQDSQATGGQVYSVGISEAVGAVDAVSATVSKAIDTAPRYDFGGIGGGVAPDDKPKTKTVRESSPETSDAAPQVDDDDLEAIMDLVEADDLRRSSEMEALMARALVLANIIVSPSPPAPVDNFDDDDNEVLELYAASI